MTGKSIHTVTVKPINSIAIRGGAGSIGPANDAHSTFYIKDNIFADISETITPTNKVNTIHEN